jgi:hypothetical protein
MSDTSMIEAPENQHTGVEFVCRIASHDEAYGCARVDAVARRRSHSDRASQRETSTGLAWIADVVDDEDIADETLHFGRDVCVVFIDIEAVNAARMRFHERDSFGLARP